MAGKVDATLRNPRWSQDFVLQALMENTDAHLAFLDSEFNFVAVNAAYASGSGHPAEELVGRNHFDLFPSEENRTIFERARDSKEVVEYRAKPFRFEDQPWRGTTYWDWRLTPLPADEDGQIGGLVLSLTDVTAAVRRSELSEALNSVNRIVHSTLDFDAVVREVMPKLRDAVGCEGAVFAVRDAGSWTIIESLGAPSLAPGTVLGDEDSPHATRAVNSGEPLVFGDTANVPIGGVARRIGAKSLMVAPVVLPEGGQAAVAYGYFSGPGVFEKDHVDFARKAASSLASALRNSRLFEERQREMERSRLLQQVAIAAGRALTLPELGSAVIGALDKITPLQTADLKKLDGDALQVVASQGFPESVREQIGRLPLTDTSYSAVRSILEMRIVTHEDEQMTPERHAILQAVGILDSRYFVAPVRHGDRALGTFALSFKGRRPFTPDELDLYAAVIDILGQAMENARLFEAERESARLGEAIQRIDRRVHSSLRIEEIVEDALKESAEAIGAQTAAIVGFAPEGWTRWYDWGFTEKAIEYRFEDEPSPQGPDAVTEKRVIAVDGGGGPEGAAKRSHRDEPVIVAPLIVRGESVAALYFNYEGPHRFGPREIEFVRNVASSLSLAIENARLYDVERGIADKLQEALLAIPEEVPSVEYSCAYWAAMESARVGGDFYDVFQLSQDHVGMVIGDVAGKGIDAAVLTSMVRNTVRAHATERGKTPARIMSLANEMVYRSTPWESFVTVFLGILDCRDGRMVYCNAGHTTAAIVRASGGCAALPLTGPLVGAFPTPEFGQAEAWMEVGDSLLLYTDGLTEARRDGVLYGEERLMQQLEHMGAAPPAEIIDRLRSDVLAYSDNNLRDDLALLCVRRLPLDDHSAQQQKLPI